MTKTFNVYKATATADKELVFNIVERHDKDQALEELNESRGGFLVTMLSDTHEVIIAADKWGKNSFSLGTMAKQDRIKGKAQAAITLDRLPLAGDEPEKQESDDSPAPKKQVVQLKEQPKLNKDGTPRKKMGRPPVVKRPQTPRLYRSYHDERGILVFTSLEYPDLEAAREAAHQDETAFVLVNVEQGTNMMRVRGTFNKAFKFFGPNQIVSDAVLHDAAIKLIGNRPPKRVATESNTETPPEPTSTSEATSEPQKDDKHDAPRFYLEHKPQVTEPTPPAELPEKPTSEVKTITLPSKPDADQIYDAIIDNQKVLTDLMIQHVEAQGSLKSLDNIVSENERQHGLLETRMLTLEEEGKEAKQKAAAKREELKDITRKIANLLGGADDATS